MQVNCSTSHILNKTVSDDELRLLARMIDNGFFGAIQRSFFESFVSRKSIENYLNPVFLAQSFPIESLSKCIRSTGQSNCRSIPSFTFK